MSAATTFVVVSAGALGVLVGPMGPPPPRRNMGSRASVRRALREAPMRLRETTMSLPLPPLRRWRARRRDAQLAGALERMASGLRAGQALSTAFVTVADEMPSPLGDDLAALATAVRNGGALAEVMTRWAHDPGGSRATTLSATAIAIGATTGGQVARSVDQVAASLRQTQQMRAEARALASQARASAALLALAPIGFTLLVAMVEPAILGFLTSTATGLACLTAGVVLELLGVRWMARIVDEER